jgi:hypothetical protein
MSRKYLKSIYLYPNRDEYGALELRAVVKARRCRGAIPTYLRNYRVTTGRARHLERLLLDRAKALTFEATEAYGERHKTLCAEIEALMNTVAMIATCAQIGYGQPPSEQALAVIELMEKNDKLRL